MACTGTGPVDAAFKAIRQQVGYSDGLRLLEVCVDLTLLPRRLKKMISFLNFVQYTVSSVTAGIDALGEVTVRIEDRDTGRIVFGRSANTDVIVASAQVRLQYFSCLCRVSVWKTKLNCLLKIWIQAYLNAVNRVYKLKGSQAPLHPQFNTFVG